MMRELLAVSEGLAGALRVCAGLYLISHILEARKPEKRELAAAAEKQIRFQAEAEFPRHTGIRDADLCAVLGNLLDNALEAAEKVEAAEGRWVRLTMRGIHQMLVIRVENGFQEKPVEERGEWKSTKTEGGLHGWGLKSARIAAEKYEGTVSTVCEQNVFRATATLCFRLSREEISGD